MTEFQIGVAAFAFLIAGIVKGAAGIGQITTAVVLLGLGLDLRAAIPLLIAPALVSNLWQAGRGPDVPVIIRRFALANLAGGIGIAGGTVILFAADTTLLSAGLGILVALYAVSNLARFDPTVPPSVEKWATPPLAFASGLVTGATGSLHLLLAAWYATLRLPRTAYIQAVGLTFMIAGFFWAGSLIWQGALTVTVALWSIAALIPTFLGMALGGWLRDKASETAFRKGVMVFLLILALSLIAKATI